MTNVSQLIPTVTEGVDSLGNVFDIHLVGMTPLGLDCVSQIPNLYFHHPESGFTYFIRLVFKDDVVTTRQKLEGYDFNLIVGMYSALLARYVRRTGMHVPDGVEVCGLAELLYGFIRDVDYTSECTYNVNDDTFMFVMGVLSFLVFPGKATTRSVSILVNGDLYQCEVVVPVLSLYLDPWSVFHMSAAVITQLERRLNTTVAKSKHLKAEFRIPS